MDNQNHCKSIRQAKLAVNAQKHNLLNSFCNNGYVYVIMKTTEVSQRERERERERMRLCQ